MNEALTTPGNNDSMQRPRVEWRSSFAVRNSLLVLASIAVLGALQWGKVLLIPCAVAVCMTFWLMPIVDRLQRMYLPRALGAALVLFALMGAIGFTGYALRDDAREFAASIPAAAHHARVIFNQAAHDPNGWIHHLRNTLNERPAIESKSRMPTATMENATDIQAAVLRGSTTAVAAAANVGAVLFLIYLMLASGDLFKRKLLTVIANQASISAATPGKLNRKRVTVEILNEIAAQFQRYLGVLAVTNLVIGLLTWAAFTMLGVEHAAVWGAAAAILHIVPYVGPALIAVASFLITTLQFDSLSQAFFVSLTSVLIFGLIGMLLTTWLAGRASKMNSVAVFIGLMFWGWLWGIPGLLLGTPLMMATKVMADRIECLNWLGIFLGDAPKRERKPAAAAAANKTVTVPVLVSTEAALTEGAVLADPAFTAAEVASETTQLAWDERSRIESSEADDSAAVQAAKLFTASPLPA